MAQSLLKKFQVYNLNIFMFNLGFADDRQHTSKRLAECEPFEMYIGFSVY